VGIYARKKQSDFKPCPAGVWNGLCIDVVDLGMVNDPKYGEKHKIQIRWVCDALPARPDGQPYMVSKKYNLSMHKKSNLRLMLDLWRNKPFTDDDAYDFDFESLVGVKCKIQVAQATGEDGAFAFPQVVLKADAAAKPCKPPANYVRECNRPGYQAPVIDEEQSEAEPEHIADEQISDDDIPF